MPRDPFAICDLTNTERREPDRVERRVREVAKQREDGQLADLRRQLSDAVESQQVLGTLMAEQQVRAEQAEKALAETREQLVAAVELNQIREEQLREELARVGSLQRQLDECEARYREPLTLELRREFLALPMHWRRRLMGAQADALVAREAAEKAEEGRKQAVEVAALRAVMIASLQGEAAAMRRALEYGIKELSAYFESLGRPGQTPKLHKVLERSRAALQPEKGGS